MALSKRSFYQQMAEETLEIIKNGFYVNPSGQKVSLEEQIKYCIVNTILYTPENTEELLARILPSNQKNKTEIIVTNETSLSAARTLKDEGTEKVIVLNFASAKNPGGGFLNGSIAQEESLARSSALYASISRQTEMYEFNRRNKTALYSDYMIYSPDVPVFRDDDGNLLENPYQVSFITSPAVNAGAVRLTGEATQEQIDQVMIKRIEKILAVSIINGYKKIVLGAFGCGVFRNDPNTVAKYFKDILIDNPKYQNQFDKIVFAVLDNSRDQSNFNAFKNLFPL